MQSGGSGAPGGTNPRPRVHVDAPAVRVLGFALLIAYLALVAWIALRPRPVPWVYDANLTPFASVRRNLAEGPWPAFKAIGGELALLAPLGVLLPMLSARLESSAVGSFLRSTAATALVAAVLAMAQSSVPGRMFNVDDVLLGTVGSALLHLAVVPAARRRMRRRAAAEGTAPSDGRGVRTPAAGTRTGTAPQPTAAPSPFTARPTATARPHK
ncbi:VanZ family protein [Mangrovactinospora gilvigrisea]|uniref:VanZ family protein n=1 Tax=Mangrovactinospora gilvigrisea TaxID=1428644 RepID=UPI0009A11D28|nr:VanZ family protein [Mangrovactinospora gilvigrisea]